MGGDVHVHGDAASDIRLCFSFLFSFDFVGAGVGERGWGRDVNVHGDAACDVNFIFSSQCLLLSWGDVWGEGMGMTLMMILLSEMMFKFLLIRMTRRRSMRMTMTITTMIPATTRMLLHPVAVDM